MTKPLYFYNGTTFEEIGPTTPQSPIAYQTSAPTGPATGDLWIDSDGDVDTYNRQLTRYYFVATAAQTTVSGTDANGLTLAYVAGSEQVYVNGALQVRGQDYTATNGTSVVMSSGLAVNDVVEIFAYTAFTVANAYTKSETDGVAAAAAGLRMVVPTSVAVGSGTGSVDAIGNVTFSGASSISLNGCFSSVYDNYRIIISNLSFSTTTYIGARLRVSGTDNSSSNYLYSMPSYTSGGTAENSYSAGLTTSFNEVARASVDTTTGVYDLIEPFLTRNTLITGLNIWNRSSTLINGNTYLGALKNSISYDGFTLFPNSGTISGTVRVYGYKD
jgi:hypothetical protein